MKVLQINSVCGFGSTGRIATDIADLLISRGDDCRIAYGRENAPEAYQQLAVRIGSNLDNKIHGLQTRLLDLHGFGSKKATKAFLKWVAQYDPDLIHLHNIHGYYIHLELLFDYLKKSGKPVVWTLHDCWTMTGHCSHFSAVQCDQWKTGCRSCPQLREYPATVFGGNVAQNYARKKQAFTGLPNMTIVTPSHWLASVVKDSFLGSYPVLPIYNGIDLNIFRPTIGDFRRKYGLEKKKIVLGVANVWTARKGLQDFVKLADMLDDSFQIVLVGLSPQQIEELPKNILGITRTSSVKELAQIYSAADVFINPSVEETMGMTTVEAMACGTPVITYNATAVPEVVAPGCGTVVPAGDVSAIAAAILHSNKEAMTDACLQAAQQYKKEDKYEEYLKLYNTMKAGS